MQTIKEYALRHKISYEAARQQVNRHADELGQNIVKIGRTRYLTDEGVAILEGRRSQNTATAKRDETQAELQNLSYQYNMIVQKLMETQEQFIREQAKNAELQAQIIDMLETKIDALETRQEAPQGQEDSQVIETPSETLETPQGLTWWQRLLKAFKGQ